MDYSDLVFIALDGPQGDNQYTGRDQARSGIMELNETREPLLIAELLSDDWCHISIYFREGDINISGIPCPYSKKFEEIGLLASPPFPFYRVELTQQKLMLSGQVWPVIRCPFCGAAIRLTQEGGAELAAACDRYTDEFYLEIARRIREGYANQAA